MQQNFPFQARGTSSNPPVAQTTLSITAAVQQLTLPVVPQEGGTLRLCVDGAANIAWSLNVTAGLTISNGVFQFANTDVSYTIPGGITQISVIGSAAAGTLRAMVGDGT